MIKAPFKQQKEVHFFMVALRQTKDFMQTIHKDNDTSYITIATKEETKWSQFHFLGVDNATNHAIKFLGQKVDVYHSNNSFSKKQRGNATLFNINTLYMDLDCHDKSVNIDWDRALEYLETLFYGVKIPVPTYTVMSGRGFQLYWAIETAPKQAIYLWKLLQVRLAQELSNITKYVPGLTVDESCVEDVTRVFRVVGTTNTEANKVATIVQSSNNRYSMSEIRDTYFEDLKPKASKSKTKTTLTRNKAVISYLYNSYSLQQARLNDLEKLIELRGGDLLGKRDELLFIYGWTVVSKKATEEVFTRELESLNTLFKEPLSDSEIRYKAKHIYNKHKSKTLLKAEPKHFYENFDVYIFRNDTIIKKLEITEEEQKHMTTLIAKREKYDRNNTKRKQSRRNEAGLTKKQQEKLDRKAKVQELKAKGYKQIEVADMLGVSLRTVKTDWK